MVSNEDSARHNDAFAMGAVVMGGVLAAEVMMGKFPNSKLVQRTSLMVEGAVIGTWTALTARGSPKESHNR